MGGNLWCRSQLGKGSTFVFHIPLEGVLAHDDNNNNNASEWRSDSPPQQLHHHHREEQQENLFPRSPSTGGGGDGLLTESRSRAHLRGLRVLVVDDNSLMRKTMNAILSKEHCLVTLAENGQQVNPIYYYYY
jgi:hypothetical protein